MANSPMDIIDSRNYTMPWKRGSFLWMTYLTGFRACEPVKTNFELPVRTSKAYY